MNIAYTEENKTLVAHLAPGVTPEQAASAMGIADGTWRVISDAEAETLQKALEVTPSASKPHVDTPEEIRIREIDAELSRLDFYAQRPLCSIVAGLGDENDEMLVQAIEAIKIDLRDERRLLLEPKSPVDEEMEEDYEEVPEGEGTVEVVEDIERSGE